jgi:hypothetical protein
MAMDHKVEKTKPLDSLHYHSVKPNTVEDYLSENGPGYLKRPEITKSCTQQGFLVALTT